MKRALALAVLGLVLGGLGGFAWDLVGIGGSVVPGLNFEDEPIFSFIPEFIVGWDVGTLAMVGIRYDTVTYEDGPWAYELDLYARLAVNFDLCEVWVAKCFIAPTFALEAAFKTAEGGLIEFTLVPNWGFRAGFQGTYWDKAYGAIYLDFQPERGIIPGFTVGLWIGR